MKNIFYCLFLLLCTPVFAGTNNAEIVSDCVIKKSTPNEKFMVFKISAGIMSDMEVSDFRPSDDKVISKLKSAGLIELFSTMFSRCEKESLTLPDEDARQVGKIVMKKIMIEIANNPKVQKLYE